jgi:hypothetical protein
MLAFVCRIFGAAFPPAGFYLQRASFTSAITLEMHEFDQLVTRPA